MKPPGIFYYSKCFYRQFLVTGLCSSLLQLVSIATPVTKTWTFNNLDQFWALDGAGLEPTLVTAVR